jgi:hypothetical protein
VDEPVVLGVAVAAAGADQGQPSGAALGGAERDDDLVVAPLLELVGAGVPDGDVAGAVLPGGDAALEGAVLQRVVLGLHGQVVLRRVGGFAAGERPADEDAVVLEAEVPVQTAGVVLLDDEGGLIGG